MSNVPTSRTAHKIEMRRMSPGETLEASGIDPEEVIEYEGSSYEFEDGYGNSVTKESINVWYITEVDVPVEECRECDSEKVYVRSQKDFLCPHCDINE